MTNGPSVYGHRFDELSRQKHALDAEEAELNDQRERVRSEKERVKKYLKRLDRKDELE